MDYQTSLPFVVLFALLVNFLFRKILSAWKVNSGLPFPPGPTPRFIIGNLREIPTKLPWLTYMEWGLKYGELRKLVYARVLGKHIIIVNSHKTASDLFDKRSHIYSDRPVVPILNL
ncbi:hypothetical protein DFH07DRAFT_739985 [Mycena maculata]|uniref:Cytochrome P450 n=1 Tax=Mycena maculata TaxID=230809 RepID=A0AAD7JF94_9AGAR|nr:hypothetical protein DFH07DRAFT_739985 [Mycena maculata]